MKNIYIITCFGHLANRIKLEIKTNKKINIIKYIKKLNKDNGIDSFWAEVELNGKLIFEYIRKVRISKKIKDKKYYKIVGYKKGKWQGKLTNNKFHNNKE